MGIAGEPPVFWRIPVDQLPDHAELEQETTDSGDTCHFNICGMSDGECRKLLKSHTVNDFEICDAGTPRELTVDDVLAQIEQ